MRNRTVYGLFQVEGGERVRVAYSDGTPLPAFPKAQAIRVYQSRLLSYAFGGPRFELARVKGGGSR